MMSPTMPTGHTAAGTIRSSVTITSATRSPAGALGTPHDRITVLKCDPTQGRHLLPERAPGCMPRALAYRTKHII